MDFPLARTNPLITHVAEGQRVTVLSIMKDPLWLLMRRVESQGWIKNGVQAHFISRKDGLRAFGNTKHLLRRDHSCAVAIPNSGLVSGAGLFIFAPCGRVQLCMPDVERCFQTRGLPFFKAAQNGTFHLASYCAEKYVGEKETLPTTSDPETGEGVLKWSSCVIPRLSIETGVRVCVTTAGDTKSNAAINSVLRTAGKLKHLSFSMH